MKYLLFVLLLVAVLITAGCTSENKNVVVTPTPITTQVPMTILTITPQTTLVSIPAQTYKTADLVIALNTDPTYGFKIDYPSEWTYKKEHTKNWKAGYNFSSPDVRSNMYVYIDDAAGSGDHYFPLDTPTENSHFVMTDGGSWAENTIMLMTEKYCINCRTSTGRFYQRRLVTNENVILSGNIKAKKLVFSPDDGKQDNWLTFYLMHIGKMQGYNFTVPHHYEVAEKVNGDVWDYGMDGQAYAISLRTPKDQVNSTSIIFDHMIKSFEVTIK